MAGIEGPHAAAAAPRVRSVDPGPERPVEGVGRAPASDRPQDPVAELRFLRRLLGLVTTAQTWEELLETVVDGTRDALGASVSSLYLLDRDGTRLTLAATNGLDRFQIGRAVVPFGEGITGRVAATREPMVIPDVAAEPRFLWVRGLDQRRFVASMLSVPLTWHDQVVGVLYAKAELLAAMPPWQGGGDMILSVSFEKSTWNEIPYKFEAGTPNIAGAIGLGAAIDYMEGLGMERIAAHEDDLLRYGSERLSAIPGLRLVGTARDKAGVLSFVLDGVHPHDIGTVLDYEGIAIRTGHHCAQPVMDRFGIPATARASLGLYNTREDLDALAAGLRKVQEMFK